MENTHNVDRLVAVYIKIREAKAAATSAYEKQDREYKEQMETVENELLRRAQEEGVTGFKTEHGTTYMETKLVASGSDWGVFYSWMKDNDAMDMLERRIKSTSIKEYMENHDNAIPPGVSIFTQLQMKVRRS